MCSRHFTDDDYVPNLPNGRIRLKSGAVPTVFEWTSMNSADVEEMSDTMMIDESNPAGFTVHVARKKLDDDITANDAAIASSAIPASLSPQNIASVSPQIGISLSPQTTGLDLSSTSKAFIALQSPQGLAIANKASQGLNNINSTPNSNSNSLPMEQDEEETPITSETATALQEQCINCEVLEGELSRASIELTNLQREKVLLHAKCAELEDEVQKIHVYCKQLKALNGECMIYYASIFLLLPGWF